MAACDLGIVAVLFSRGFDVRLLLLLGALPLFVATGQVPAMIVKIAAEMANAGTVVPICAALGFAFVLRLTECDQHLVRLLVRPLERVRHAPGSRRDRRGLPDQHDDREPGRHGGGPRPDLDSALGAGGLSAVSAGSVLLLGSSMGGELFNPGSVEMRKLSGLTGLSSTRVVGQSARLNLLACGTALGAFWLLSLRRNEHAIDVQNVSAVRGSLKQAESAEAPAAPINLIKALVPVLPIVLLTLDGLFGPAPGTTTMAGPERILAALLIGVVAAGLTDVHSVGGLAAAFFDGAGYGYNHVISLIVAASTFAEGIRLSGMIELMIATLAPYPQAALIVATVAPWGLAFVAGTGIAPAIAIMEFFVPVSRLDGDRPGSPGHTVITGSAFRPDDESGGRRGHDGGAIVRRAGGALVQRVAGPLLIGGAVLIAAALAGLL